MTEHAVATVNEDVESPITDYPLCPIAEFNATEIALADFKLQYQSLVFNVATTAGMADAKAARMTLRGHRTSLEKRRKQLKEDILVRGRLIDGEAKRITAEIEALEDPIDAQIKAEENRKEAERQEKARQEAARVKAINDKIDAIRNHGATVQTELADLTALLDQAKAIQISQDEFQEFAPLALLTRDTAIAQLQALADARRTFEQQCAEQEAEQQRQAEEAAKLRAEQAQLQREREELQRQKDEHQAMLAQQEAAAAAEAPAAKEAEEAVHPDQIPLIQPEPAAIPADPSDDLPWGNPAEGVAPQGAHYITEEETLISGLMSVIRETVADTSAIPEYIAAAAYMARVKS